jgi:hypothetical protein
VVNGWGEGAGDGDKHQPSTSHVGWVWSCFCLCYLTGSMHLVGSWFVGMYKLLDIEAGLLFAVDLGGWRMDHGCLPPPFSELGLDYTDNRKVLTK